MGAEATNGDTSEKTQKTNGEENRTGVKETPWAQLLITWAWQHRDPRPIAAAAIARHIGYSKQAVAAWMFSNVEPPLSTMLYVIKRLGISTDELLTAYAEAQLPDQRPTVTVRQLMSAKTPHGEPTSPPTRASSQTLPSASMAHPWNTEGQQESHKDTHDYREIPYSLRQTQTALREAGAPESLIASVTAHLQAAAAGEQPFARNIITEHTEATDTSTPKVATEQKDNQAALGTKN